MTVIKFKDKEVTSIIKPGVNRVVSRVFESVVKYCLKENLPDSAGRDELIFTTDTHEFFRGNGNGLDLIPFNTVLMYSSFSDFPAVGIETKLYVDKSTSLMFTWNGESYVSLSGGGDGEIIIAPSDAKIGDLSKLETTDKTTVVAAINEVFNSLVTIDIDNVLTHIEAMEIDIEDIKNTLAGGDLTAIANLEVQIGDLESLTTAEKTSLVGAINELKTLIGSGTGGGDSTDVAIIVGTLSELKTIDKGNVVAAINEVFTRAHNNSIHISNINPAISALESKYNSLDFRITEIEESNVTIENNVSVLQSTVVDIDNSITQVNNIIGDLSGLSTSDKGTIVAAINELVIQIGALGEDSGNLDELTNLVSQLDIAIGELSGLTTTAKKDLVAAINELVERIAGVDDELRAEISLLQNNIDEIEATVATNTASISTLTDRTSNVELRISSLEEVNLTEEDKQNYLNYQDLVTSLLNEMVPELQSRISTLEIEVARLSEFHSGSGGSGGYSGDNILWEHEFVLPVGVAVYELGEDPEWINNGYTMDLMEDLYGDKQRVRLYSLGNAGYAPTEPVEVPLVGTEGEPPTVHGVWESYTGTDVIFEVASLIAWRFRLVKYAD